MPKKSPSPSKTKPRKHGGKRKGSGRPKGTGNWGEETWPLRIPLSLYDSVKEFLEKRGMRMPLYAAKVPAGFPEHAADDIDEFTHPNALLLKNTEDSFLLRVKGDSMINAGILDGDILVVSKKKEAANGQIVVAMIDNQATVKRLKRDKSGVLLMPENDNYKPIKIGKDQELCIAGVVTGSLRQYS